MQALGFPQRLLAVLHGREAGELERLTADADGVTIGVVTTAGKREQGRFALDNAVKLLAYFNDYFGAKYPLPKLDLIAVPGGFGGAMENWGGITFFESRLLFDPATNADTARRGIFSILAHEMAHQWFGDLVTMQWWDNLWLNEGFASWMGSKCSAKFNPEWEVHPVAEVTRFRNSKTGPYEQVESTWKTATVSLSLEFDFAPFHHWDVFALGPALGYLHSGALGTTVGLGTALGPLAGGAAMGAFICFRAFTPGL